MDIRLRPLRQDELAEFLVALRREYFRFMSKDFA
jgi:ribosomal protein L29